MPGFAERIASFLWGVYGRYVWDSDRESSSLEIEKLTKLVMSLRRRPGEHVLDAGCGTGSYSLRLAEAGFRVAGIDNSKGMIRTARRKIPDREKLSLTFDCASLSSPLPYPDASFDYVINVSVLHLLEDPVSTLHEFERCLKPGGYAIIVHYPKRKCHAQPSTPSDASFIKTVSKRAKAYIEKKGFSRYWTCAELKSQIQKTHLEITEVEDKHPIVIVARKPGKG